MRRLSPLSCALDEVLTCAREGGGGRKLGHVVCVCGSREKGQGPEVCCGSTQVRRKRGGEGAHGLEKANRMQRGEVEGSEKSENLERNLKKESWMVFIWRGGEWGGGGVGG